jgi:uncharacterized protein (UPF0332 family)
MTFDPLQFLDLAQAIASGEEAYTRTSISRAYYAIFLKARENLAQRGLMTKRDTGADHGEVIRVLKREKRVTAGNQLDKLREMRWKADYNVATAVSDSDSKDALEIARQVRRSLAPDWGIDA